MGDIITIAFYYLLLSGKYTKPYRVKQNGWLVCCTRTHQFQVRDIVFWKNRKFIPRYSPLEHLLTANSDTMRIYNQKNGHMRQTLH